MVIRPADYETLTRKKRRPSFLIDDTRKRVRDAASMLAKAVQAISYPLGDVIALVRRRIATR